MCCVLSLHRLSVGPVSKLRSARTAKMARVRSCKCARITDLASHFGSSCSTHFSVCVCACVIVSLSLSPFLFLSLSPSLSLSLSLALPPASLSFSASFRFCPHLLSAQSEGARLGEDDVFQRASHGNSSQPRPVLEFFGYEYDCAFLWIQDVVRCSQPEALTAALHQKGAMIHTRPSAFNPSV